MMIQLKRNKNINTTNFTTTKNNHLLEVFLIIIQRILVDLAQIKINTLAVLSTFKINVNSLAIAKTVKVTTKQIHKESVSLRLHKSLTELLKAFYTG